MIAYIICGLFAGVVGFVLGWGCDWYFGDGESEENEREDTI